MISIANLHPHQAQLFLRPLWPSQPQGTELRGMATPVSVKESESHPDPGEVGFLIDNHSPSRRVSIMPLPEDIKVYTDNSICNTRVGYEGGHQTQDGSLHSEQDTHLAPHEASKSFTFIYANK